MVYKGSPKYQEKWNKEYPTKKNSHPLMHLTNTMSAWAQNNQNWTASKQVQSAKLTSLLRSTIKPEGCSCKSTIKHYHHQGETWKPKLKSLKKCVKPKWNSDDQFGPAGAAAPPPRIVCKDRFDPGVGAWVSMTPSACETSRQRVFDEIASNAS